MPPSGLSESLIAPVDPSDLENVWSRASILLLLGEQLGLFRPKLPGEVRNVIFSVFAKFPIKRLEPGVVHNGFPLDVQEFMKQVKDELRRIKGKSLG